MGYQKGLWLSSLIQLYLPHMEGDCSLDRRNHKVGFLVALRDGCFLQHLSTQSFFFVFIHLFIYDCPWSLWLWRGLFLIVAGGGYSLLWYEVFSLWWLVLLQSAGPRAHGLQQLQHVESSWTRDHTRVPCTLAGRFLSTVPPGKSSTYSYWHL